MAIRTDIYSVDWSVSPRVIWIDIAFDTVDVQDMYDTCKHLEFLPNGMDEKPLCDAGGKEALDDTVSVGITMSLYDAVYAFTDRPGPTWVVCNMKGGNVVAFTDDTRTTSIYPRKPTAYVSADRSASSSATLVGIDGLTTEQDAILIELHEKSKHLTYVVYIDLGLVALGDGSQKTPFNDLSTAIDHAENEGITDLIVLSDITLDRSMKNFRITGIGVPTIDCNNQDCTGMEFWHVQMEGSYIGAIIVQESVLKDGFWLNGNFEKNALAGDLHCISNANIFMLGNSSGIPGLNRPTISMNPVGWCNLRVGKNSGGLTIKDCDNPLDVVTVEVSEGALTFDSTCSDGVMVARGTCVFEDQTAPGALVHDQTESPIESHEVWKAHYHRRKWDKVAKTITQYDEDKVTPEKVFDTNDDLSDITPQ